MTISDLNGGIGITRTYHTNTSIVMTLDPQRCVIPVDGSAAVIRHFCETVEAPQLIVGPGGGRGHVDTVSKQVWLAVVYKSKLLVVAYARLGIIYLLR